MKNLFYTSPKYLQNLKGLDSSASEIDLAVGTVLNNTDFNNIYINTMYYTKSHKTAPIIEKVIATKTGVAQITVSTVSQISTYDTAQNYSIVIKYTTNIYKSYIIKDMNVTTGVLNLDRNLEDLVVDSFMMMHDSPAGQHLSDYGYAGLSQYVFNELQQERKITSVKWKMNPYELTGSGSWSNPDIFDLNGNVFLDVSFLGGVNGGGSVPNGGTMGASIGMIDANPDTSTTQRKRYSIRTGVLGGGVSFPVTLGIDGYIELGIGIKLDTSYVVNSTTYYARGSVDVKLLDDANNVLFSKNISSSLDKITIPISSSISNGKLTFTAGSAEPTQISISEIIIWEGTIEAVNLKNKSIGLIGDSWTQYPSTSTEYPSKPYFPNGTIAEGYQFLSVKMQEYSLIKNQIIDTRNYGRGGQTSAWGKFWTKNLKENSLDYAICLFFTNDNNSVDEYTGNIASTYDFSPTSAYTVQLSNAGGVFGSVSYDLWLLNIQNIMNQINGLGAKAIIIMPSHTSSAAQTNSHMNMYGMFIKQMY